MRAIQLTVHRSCSGVTLVELLISAAITSGMAIGLLVGGVLVQKSFAASRHHVDAQAQQLRLTDYMALDLRRALTVTTTPDKLTLTIPDFYGADGQPRDPVIQRGLAKYGPTPIEVSYYKQGGIIFRKEGAIATPLATDVLDFRLAFEDLGQSITASVTFLPRFQFNLANANIMRDATMTSTTTLLRNKRQN